MKYLFILFFLTLSVFALDIESDKSCKTDTIEDLETKKTMQNWMDGGFGLKPHYTNYFLPYGYREGEYKSYIPSDEYTNIEAEVQISLELYLNKNLLGLNEKYYLAYTHKAFWQIYSSSSPFRETNYNPEAFMRIPILDSSFVGLRLLELGFAHMSNGQGNIEEVSTLKAKKSGLENRSRSVNYIYSILTLQHNNLITEFKTWMPYFGEDLDDNSDIMDYTGYTSLKFNYFWRQHMFTLKGRINYVTGLGAVETTYSYPLLDDVYVYGKIFSGYGESLIDYNNYITKFSIGFSFSR